MRKKLVVGNWKMHGSLASSTLLLETLREQLTHEQYVDAAVCVPFVFLPLCQQMLGGSNLAWGAQNVSEHTQGAYTGEISAAMLTEFGSTYAIVGHSERRALYGEHDSQIANKLKQALAVGLKPILCVGETLTEREAGQTETIITRQINAVLNALEAQEASRLIVAYEPVWAVGSGKTATPEQAQAIHFFIRTLWARRFAEQAASLRVLYGGSVKADNARPLFAQPDIDGGLVGGAALDAAQFCAIIHAAQQPIGNGNSLNSN